MATTKVTLSDRERFKMLRDFDELVPRIPKRGATTVDQELAEVRRARKAGGCWPVDPEQGRFQRHSGLRLFSF